jgi:NAD(P) transhydrogenase subunit alpha
MEIAIARERLEGERRVALVPDTVARMVKDGWSVRVEQGAGAAAGHLDPAYVDAGARLVDSLDALYDGVDVVAKVNRPLPGVADGRDEADLIPEGAALVSFLNPLGEPERIGYLADRKVTAFSMELIPRISRAQSMDALSSMSTVAGYEAVLIGARALDKFFPLLMTAAGTVAPAKVLVLGAGVAGLQAIATARRLGAVVSAFDTRAVVKEQVQSLGATFIELELDTDAEAAGGYARELTEEEHRRETELVATHVAASDVVITTALIPGRPAPVLIPAEVVERMRPGAVIVDLASENGGNCAVTRHGEEVVHAGVHVLGPANLASQMPLHASQLYAKNVHNLLQHLAPKSEWNLDFEDEIVTGTCACHAGEVRTPRVRELLGLTSTPSGSAQA